MKKNQVMKIVYSINRVSYTVLYVSTMISSLVVKILYY